MVDIDREVPGNTAEKNLAGANPDRLSQAHRLHLPGVNAAGRRAGPSGLRFRIHGIDDPHHNPADQQGSAHDVQALQMFADDLGQEKSRNCGGHKSNSGQAQRMSQSRRDRRSRLAGKSREIWRSGSRK